MGFTDFFLGVGRVFQKVFHIIKAVVPEQVLDLAIDKATQAADQFVDNTERREWAVKELMKVPGVTESVARLATELAVQHIKADAIEQAAEKAKHAVQQ